MSDQRDESEPAGAGTDGEPEMIDVTPAPEMEQERPPETHPRRRYRGIIGLSALVILVLALATSPYWAPPVESVLPWGGTSETQPAPADTAAIEAKLSALEARVAELARAEPRIRALEQRVAQLEQRPATTPAPNPQQAQQAAQQAEALSALGDRLAAIEQRITALAAATSETAADATKGLQDEVQALSRKLDEQAQLLAKVQGQEASGAERADAALVVTVGQLRAVLATSHPYAAELQAVEALAKDRPDILKELQTLDARADRGIPAVAALTEHFDAVADQVDRASPPPPETGWSGRLAGWAKGLFHIRRVADEGAQPSNDPEDVLAAGETALERGDLAGAVEALRRLQGPAAEAAQPWLVEAQARLDADRTLASLDVALMHDVLAAPAGAKP